MEFNLSWETVVISQLVIIAAYLVFGIAGFGTALISAPLLAHAVPVGRLIPVLALLDFVAAVTNVVKDRHKADYREVSLLIPCMVMGSLAGAWLLLTLQPRILLLALGIFAVAYGIYALSRFKPTGSISKLWSVPIGLVGGVFSALFGSGGFIYAMYLSNRIDTKEGVRATQSSIIGLSTLTRAVLFLIAGVYADLSLLLYVALLLPAMFAGVYIGRHITLRMTREQFLMVINVLLIANGGALILRYFGGA
jgi:uncharacterized membrane protein YfcA